MRNILALAFVIGCGGGEGDGKVDKVARCYLSSTVVPAVQSCIEFSPLDEAALQEAKAACDQPETGVVKSWTEGSSCTSIGRIGQCTVTQKNVRSVTYVYSTGEKDTDDFARQHAKESCLAGQNSEPPGVWSDLFDS